MELHIYEYDMSKGIDAEVHFVVDIESWKNGIVIGKLRNNGAKFTLGIKKGMKHAKD
jgi:hypothetical protein